MNSNTKQHSQLKQRLVDRNDSRSSAGETRSSGSLEAKVRQLKQQQQRKPLQPLLYALIIVILMAFSFAFGYYYHILQLKRLQSRTTTEESPKPSTDTSFPLQPFPALHFGYLSEKERKAEANRLFQQAATYSGEKGEGRLGWLHLLAAYSLDRGNPHIVANLIQNYQAVQYENLAYSTLVESELPVKTKRSLLSEEIREEWKETFQQLQQQLTETTPPAGGGINPLAQQQPAVPCVSLLFSTVIARWNLDQYFSNRQLNQEIYEQSISAYHQLVTAHPELSSTDVNHAFFRVQMQNLDDSGTFWNPLVKIAGFSELVLTMRRCAVQFLRDYHGWTADAAIRKASQSLVVWISVHTETSTHQPHVTEDALVGGVYYVKTPVGSGPLDLFDPRGKHPLYGLHEPMSPPEPPFHRTHSIQPRESTLVLFPGSLVHSVRSSVNHREEEGGGVDFQGDYRVSMSLNLKGEWMDTSNAGFGCPTEQY